MSISAEHLLLLKQLDNVRIMAGWLLAICIIGPILVMVLTVCLYNEKSISDRACKRACFWCGLVFLTNFGWLGALVFVPDTEEVLRAVCLSQIQDIKNPDELRAAHARALEMTRLLLLQRPDPPPQQPEQENKEKDNAQSD